MISWTIISRIVSASIWMVLEYSSVRISKRECISSGLNTDVYKFGGTGKYDVEDARELYQDSAGRYFIVSYGEKRTDDRIASCTLEEAKEFIAQHGYLE